MPSRYRGAQSFHAFASDSLRTHLDDNDRMWQAQIEREAEDYILNVNETRYVDHVAQAHTIEGVSIDFDGVSASSYEKHVPAEQFPGGGFGFNVTRGRTYPKQVIVYHLPYTGNADLLRYRPSQRLIWTTEIYLEGQDVCFELISFTNDIEAIKGQAEATMGSLRTQLGYAMHEIDGYNDSLRSRIQHAFLICKQKILATHNMMADLGVPIKKRDNLPGTYSVPTPQVRTRMIAKPTVTETGYKPEPTLDTSIYQDILQTIHDIGKVMERLPATYHNKGEEDLRDHLLLYLTPRYESSVTGETFNKGGKTDILIRHENSNVFVAECKFWHGPQQYLETISQLLGYLTWRDSKAAVVVFIRNKDISTVLQAVTDRTVEHPNYLGFINRGDDGWFNYRFHINDDPNREVQLAVLLIHIPPP